MSERIVIQCPSCEAKFAVSDESRLGKTLQCSKCAERFVAKAMGSNSSAGRSAARRATPKPRSNDDDFDTDDDQDVEADERPTRRRSQGTRRGGRGTSKVAKSNLPLIVGGAIGGLILVGAVLFFVLRPVTQPATQPAVAQSGQEVAAGVPATSNAVPPTQPVAQAGGPTAPSSEPVAEGCVDVEFEGEVDAESLRRVVGFLTFIYDKGYSIRTGNGVTTLTLQTGERASNIAFHIHFGQVTQIDVAQRRLKIRLDPAKVANLHPPAGFKLRKSKLQTAGKSSTPAGGPTAPSLDTVSVEFVGSADAGALMRVGARLNQLNQGTGFESSLNNGVATLTLKGVTDAKAVAAVVDFGEVTQVDAEKRRLTIRLDQAKVAKLDDPFKAIFGTPKSSAADATTTTATKNATAVPLVETTVGSVVLVPQTVLDGKVQLLVPKTFTVMSEAMKATKYPAGNRPTLVFTNDEGTVNLALNHTKNPMKPSQLPDFHRSMATQFRPVAQDWLSSELLTINGVLQFELDFRSRAIDTVIRNKITGMSLNDRLLLIALNATQAEEANWEKPFATILRSIKVTP